MQVAEIELYRILKTRFTDQEAESIIASVEQKINNRFEERKNEFATKEDIGKVKEDIRKLDVNIANLETKIAESKSEMIKWMFIFWLGQFASSIAIAKFFFSK